MKKQIIFPSEWEPQSAIAITWPAKNSDWESVYDKIEAFYTTLVSFIWPVQKLIIITEDEKSTRAKLFPTDYLPQNVKILECPINDTWIRDYGAVTVYKDEQPFLYNFQFNGWGLKYAANFDNQVNAHLFKSGLINPQVSYKTFSVVLEGGSIESDGNGTIMTTTKCFTAPNRNIGWEKKKAETFLLDTFMADQILWLEHGYIIGDDTDGHIDTLARFCPNNIIAYVKCENKKDEHYEEFQKMEKELSSFRNKNGEPYKLVPLPLPDPIYDGNRRLPATYANFLIMNKRILYPLYDQPGNDINALQSLMGIFPGKDIKGIDCKTLIMQNGSLHCSTMQFPQGVF